MASGHCSRHGSRHGSRQRAGFTAADFNSARPHPDPAAANRTAGCGIRGAGYKILIFAGRDAHANKTLTVRGANDEALDDVAGTEIAQTAAGEERRGRPMHASAMPAPQRPGGGGAGPGIQVVVPG